MNSFPYITAATAVVLAVLQMLLMLHTARGRGKYQTGLGDGGHPGLLKRIRMHGNLAENAPLFLILLGLTEVSGQWTMLVPWFALGFVVVRLSHVLGLALSSGVTPFRFVGVIGTLASILGLAALLAITLARDTHWIPHLLPA
ncbi:MAG: MAPEG family protein [Proteobacteria bacterium]|nr:MAPEG family protein [Pseudomonadota bacterium]